MKKMTKLVIFLIWMGIPAYFFASLQQKCINRWKEQADENQELFLIMQQWFNIHQEGKRVEDYLKKNNYRVVAIYGMGYLGQCLIKELRDTEIKVAYRFDSDCSNSCLDIMKVTTKDNLLMVDAVIVTALGKFDVICDMLSEKLDCPLIAIEDILNEI